MENINQNYDFYSQYANKTLYDNIQTVYFVDSNRDQIKNHIYNYGALSISMVWNSSKGRSGISRNTDLGYSYKYPSAQDEYSGGHAITAIGWDDKVTATIDGKKYTGAWICLNSWGEDVYNDDDGVLYVFYDDTDLRGSLYGYKFKASSNGLYFNNRIMNI